MRTTPSPSSNPAGKGFSPRSTKTPFNNGFLVKFFKAGKEHFFFADRNLTQREGWILPRQKGPIPTKKEHSQFIRKGSKETPLTLNEVLLVGRLLTAKVPPVKQAVHKPAKKRFFFKLYAAKSSNAIYEERMGVPPGRTKESVKGPDKVPTSFFFKAEESILSMNRARSVAV